MREVAARFDREHEPGRRPIHPGRDRLALREAVERVVYLDGVEEGRVMLEPAPLRKPLRVDTLPPVGVVPAGAADADRAHQSLVSARRCSMPTLTGVL